MPPPHSSISGIKKPSKGKPRDSGLEQIELAVNEGKLHPAKAAMAVDQAVLSDASSRHEQHDDVGHEGQSSSHAGEQSSSTAHKAPAAATIKAGDDSDTDMSEVDSHSGATAETSLRGVSRDGVGTTPYSQRDDTLQNHDDAASEDGESLGRLDPLPGPSSGQPSNSTPVHDDLIDGWGTFRGSTFVIIRSGPRQSAMYRFEYRPNYENEEMRNISDEESRISSLRDKDSSGKKHWRYSRDNVEDIYGVTSEVRNPYKEYKNPPCVWVKIKWKGLIDGDQGKVVRGCSWIPRSEFTRFCGGKRATMVKIHEFWDKQEKRYQKFLENADGGAYEDRSPTPCPLGLSSNSSHTRRSTSRLQTPENRPEDPGRHQTRTPSRRSVPRSSQVNQTDSHGSSNYEGLSPSRETTAAPSSHVQKVTNEPGAESQESRFVQTWEEFVTEMAREENWQELDENDRMTKRAMAKGSYHVYCETVARTRKASPAERAPVTGAPQIPVH